MSHSQFHCTGHVYLDLHGLIFETSICYWQDQPGSPFLRGAGGGRDSRTSPVPAPRCPGRCWRGPGRRPLGLGGGGRRRGTRLQPGSERDPPPRRVSRRGFVRTGGFEKLCAPRRRPPERAGGTGRGGCTADGAAGSVWKAPGGDRASRSRRQRSRRWVAGGAPPGPSVEPAVRRNRTPKPCGRRRPSEAGHGCQSF